MSGVKVGNSWFSDESVAEIKEKPIEESVKQFPHIPREVLEVVKGETPKTKKK
jgi:hypothetical protein